MTGITKWNDTGDDMFCKSQLITCNRVKECNGVCPFEDALKHADREQSLNEQNIDHDRDWIIGCIEHDGFIHTHRFDKANQIILDALSAEAVEVVRCKECKYAEIYDGYYTQICCENGAIGGHGELWNPDDFCSYGERKGGGSE